MSKFDRRVPVVVFKRGNNLVAFPVNLKTGVSSAKGQEVMNILGGDKSIGKSVVEVNNILLENGLPGSLFFRGVNDQNIFLEDGSYSQEVLDVVAKLDSMPAKPDLLSLEREALPTSVSSPINLSSRPITSPKIVMDLENMVVSNTAPAPAVVQQQEKEKKVKEVKPKQVAVPKKQKDNVKKVQDFEQERGLFLNSNTGKIVTVNGFTGVLNKINDFRYEIVDGSSVFEVTVEDITSFESKRVKHEVANLSEGSVDVNGVSYTVVLNRHGNVESLSPKNNPSQVITNEKMLIAVDIERSKQEVRQLTN